MEHEPNEFNFKIRFKSGNVNFSKLELSNSRTKLTEKLNLILMIQNQKWRDGKTILHHVYIRVYFTVGKQIVNNSEFRKNIPW